ncbi:MAG: hypothetical protein ACLFTA_02060 [Candidatus Nanohaloarchaea archaeon]
MKASLEGSLPMMGLLVMSLVLATQSIPISDAMNEVVGETTQDLKRTVDTRAYSDFYFYNHVPLASQFAANNASYSLGQNGGGVEWTSSWLGDYSSNMQDIIENLNQASSRNLTSTVSGSTGNCRIPSSYYQAVLHPEKDVAEFEDLEAKDTEVSVSRIHSHSIDDPLAPMLPEPLTTTCSFGGQESQYQDEALFYSAETEAKDNRYVQLADESLKFFKELKQELNTVTEETDEQRSCGSYPSKSSVEEEAAEEVEASVEEKIEEVKSKYPSREGLSIEELETDADATFKYGHESEILNASSSSTLWEGDCCANCSDEDKENKTYKYTRVTVTPENTDINWRLKDQRYSVLSGDSFRRLEFQIKPFSHEFQ